jgi:hypothetical protein
MTEPAFGAFPGPEAQMRLLVKMRKRVADGAPLDLLSAPTRSGDPLFPAIAQQTSPTTLNGLRPTVASAFLSSDPRSTLLIGERVDHKTPGSALATQVDKQPSTENGSDDVERNH